MKKKKIGVRGALAKALPINIIISELILRFREFELKKILMGENKLLLLPLILSGITNKSSNY